MIAVPSVLYLHGFASGPGSAKVQALRALLAADGIELNAPDLNAPSFANLDFGAVVSVALEAGRAHPPAAVVGSSLGSLAALEVVRRGIAKPLVLLAPALGVADQWIERLPAGDPISVYNHAQEHDAWIHRAFFEQMARVDSDRDAPRVPVTVIMGRNDESVPFERVAAVWRRWEKSGRLAAGSRFVEIPNGDHGLTAFAGEIAREIRKAVAYGSGMLAAPVE